MRNSPYYAGGTSHPTRPLRAAPQCAGYFGAVGDSTLVRGSAEWRRAGQSDASKKSDRPWCPRDAGRPAASPRDPVSPACRKWPVERPKAAPAVPFFAPMRQNCLPFVKNRSTRSSVDLKYTQEKCNVKKHHAVEKEKSRTKKINQSINRTIVISMSLFFVLYSSYVCSLLYKVYLSPIVVGIYVREE